MQDPHNLPPLSVFSMEGDGAQKMWKKRQPCFSPPTLAALGRAHGILSIQFGRKMIPPMKSCQMTPLCCTITFLLRVSWSPRPLTLLSITADHEEGRLLLQRQNKVWENLTYSVGILFLCIHHWSKGHFFGWKGSVWSPSFRLCALENLDTWHQTYFPRLPGSVVQAVGSGSGLIFTWACHYQIGKPVGDCRPLHIFKGTYYPHFLMCKFHPGLLWTMT